MNKKIITALLCFALLLGLAGCSEQQSAPAKEDAGGTGFDTARSYALVEQDLYFLRPGTERSEIEWALGSPQTFVLSAEDQCVYYLSGGEKLTLDYSMLDRLEKATYLNAEGKTLDFFAYLKDLGIIISYNPDGSINQTPQGQTPSEDPMPSDDNYYFSIRQHSTLLAEQILKIGVARTTVLTAFGKPNGFGSVDYQKGSYIIDVYAMEDGSTLYLDYGYSRETLRAVRKSQGATVSDYLGEWGAQENTGVYRGDRNVNLFYSLKKNTKPSEIYRRLGEPDWLEGNANRYRDAYQLKDGSVVYLDFGTNHASLAAVNLMALDGDITPITLR